VCGERAGCVRSPRSRSGLQRGREGEVAPSVSEACGVWRACELRPEPSLTLGPTGQARRGSSAVRERGVRCGRERAGCGRSPRSRSGLQRGREGEVAPSVSEACGVWRARGLRPEPSLTLGPTAWTRRGSSAERERGVRCGERAGCVRSPRSRSGLHGDAGFENESIDPDKEKPPPGSNRRGGLTNSWLSCLSLQSFGMRAARFLKCFARR